MLTLTRDGRPITTGNIYDLMRYVHQNHGYSFSHACEHEGYAVTGM